MKIYEARGCLDYEGYFSKGLFDTIEKAIEATKKCSFYDDLEVVEFELNKPEDGVTVWLNGEMSLNKC